MEIFTGKKPNYSRFHVFGALCFHKVLPLGNKLEERAHRSIILGFPLGQKGYKVLNLKTNIVVSTREVEFFNDVFPFTKNPDHHVLEDGRHQLEETGTHEIRTKSRRQIHRPTWLNDYILTTAGKESVDSHCGFLSKIMQVKEPKNFTEAFEDPNWVNAMQQEIKALEENGPWQLTTLPMNKREIDSKWEFKVKYKANGEVERYKARVVEKGFNQIPGIDFVESFSPVAKIVTMRLLFSIAVTK